MTSPKYKHLGGCLEATKYWNWFSVSKNRFKKKARNALRRASRRELKRLGKKEIREQLEAML